MNCVNCGAPPKRGATECRYCETPLEKKEPRANYAGFVRAVASCEDDYYRTAAVATLSGRFTAGQARAILSKFEDDYYRMAAAATLVPKTLNKGKLFGAASLFEDDYYRTGFLSLLGNVQPAVDEDEEGGEEEDAEVRPPRHPPQAPRPTPVGWYVAAFLLVLLILSLVQ